MDNNKSDADSKQKAFANDALLGLSVVDFDKAREIVKRCHELFYGKIGAALIADMKEHQVSDDSTDGQAYMRGVKDGKDKGLGFFPSGVEAISVSEVLTAVYGSPNK